MPRHPSRSPGARRDPRDYQLDDLAAENNDIRHKQNAEAEALEDTLHNAQYALDKVSGDKLKLENEFKIQVDNDAITVNRLKNEGIDMKHVLADRNEEIAKLKSTLSNLQYSVDLKRGDLKHLEDEFKINREDNDQLKGIANHLDKDIKVEIDVNNGLKKDLDNTEAAIKHNDDASYNHKNRIQDLERALSDSNNLQNNLNRDIDENDRRIRDVTAQINVLDDQAKGLAADLDHLLADIDDLKGKLDAENDLWNKVRADLDREIARGKDLAIAHDKLTAGIADNHAELEGLKREGADLDDKIRDITAVNADIEYQINELRRHIEVLTKQNTDLNWELDHILMTDAKVREELERRSTLAEKQRINDDQLKSSINDLKIAKSHSPSRP